MKHKKKQLTIGIPAYNEEKRIAFTIETVYKVAEKVLDDYEILIVDDGSIDQTYEVVQEIICRYGNHHIEVFRKKTNEGVGAAFHHVLKNARFPYVCLIPGDNAFATDGIKLLFSEVGNTPLVISYRKAMNHIRTRSRYFLSKIATTYLSVLTGKKIKDAHSMYIFPVDITRSLKIKNASYGYHMEILSRLLRRINNFKEVPVDLTPNPDANSGVIRIRILIGCGITMLKLIGLRLVNKL